MATITKSIVMRCGAAALTARPVAEVLPLAQANAAIAKCKDGSARYRMVLEM